MMTKQMTKPSMDDLPRCSSTLSPAAKTWWGGGDRVLGPIYFSFLMHHATGRNMFGCYMLRPFADPVTCSYVLLGVVAQSLKPVKLLGTCKRTQQGPRVANI